MREKIKWTAILLFLLLVVYGSHTLSRAVVQNLDGAGTVEVILDPGHGENDPGKVGVNGALEKDLNLQIALQVKELLEEQNITVQMTRESDQNLAPEDAQNQKTADMQERVKLINTQKPAVTVSIHQNSYPDESVKGAQVFYFTHSKEGKEMAEILQQSLKTISSENNRQAKANDTYYLLRRTEVPAVIVECGFLSNWEEAEKLTDPQWQQQIAQAITNGILQILEKN